VATDPKPERPTEDDYRAALKVARCADWTTREAKRRACQTRAGHLGPLSIEMRHKGTTYACDYCGEELSEEEVQRQLRPTST